MEDSLLVSCAAGINRISRALFSFSVARRPCRVHHKLEVWAACSFPERQLLLKEKESLVVACRHWSSIVVSVQLSPTMLLAVSAGLFQAERTVLPLEHCTPLSLPSSSENVSQRCQCTIMNSSDEPASRSAGDAIWRDSHRIAVSIFHQLVIHGPPASSRAGKIGANINLRAKTLKHSQG